MRSALILLVVLAVFALAVMHWIDTRSDSYPLRTALHRSLGSVQIARYVPQKPDSLRWRVLRFYRQRHSIPAWVDSHGLLGRGKELVAVIDSAVIEGLNPADYHTPELETLLHETHSGPLTSPGADKLAELDVLLTSMFLRYGSDRLSGRVNPARLPTDWYTRPRRADWVTLLDQAVSTGSVKATLGRLDPPYPDYARLREALRSYRAIASRGGWPSVPPGPPLKRGSRGPRVVALRNRLAASGDLRSPGSTAVFDGELEAAVRHFQARCGLEATGIVRADELADLNVSAPQRVRQIQLNMERWRWLPATLGSRYILVNIPDYRLDVMDGGRSVLAMRVVVGKEYSRTPVFSDTMTDIVFHPAWNIPASIAQKELGDSVRADPDYLSKRHMHVYAGPTKDSREVDAKGSDLNSVFSEGSKYSIRQDPGPTNPLGRIKFLFPNKFNVYLHDTPAGHLFSRNERDFSHGCIRIEKPVDLADYLLPSQDGWGPERVANALGGPDEEKWVKVPHPISVHILYWTAWQDPDGTVEFRDDLYGIDDVVDRALSERTVASIPTSARLRGTMLASMGNRSEDPEGIRTSRGRRHGRARDRRS
jgi:murein L,D-transpeptidase YcbB/YkuD